MLRARTKTKSGGWSGSETYAYSDDSDAPAWIEEGSNWTRYVPGIDGQVAATQTSSGALSWTVSNIRGDMIAEAGGAGLVNVREVDEFGNVKGGLPQSRPYGFHGSKVRQTLTDGGVIAMGVRLYSPSSGRFLQTDPVLGGTENPYEYPTDAVNRADLDGRKSRPAKQTDYKTSAHTFAEKAWCLAQPWRWARCKTVRELADKAGKSARRHFGSTPGGLEDAFRHCFWSGMMAMRWGKGASRGFGNRHEKRPNNPRNAKRMDLRNNGIGRRYGSNSKSDGQISRKCFDAANGGYLTTIN